MSTTNTKKYWAFISYSSLDAKWGKWLHKRLEQYAIPAEFQGIEFEDGTALGKHIRPVFRDRDELAGSAELGPAIAAALEQSRFLIVLCSPNSAKSKWVNKEIEDFRALHGDDKVLALIVDGEPNASSNPAIEDSLECFPPALRSPLEPLAGDLRIEGDGKERGFLKILSGIADIGFDDLYRRHERAQRKRRVAWAAVASIIIAALAGLSIFAMNQKSVAEAQTAIAEAETKRANEQTEEAKRQTGIANAQTKVAEKQTGIAEDKTKEAKEQAEEAKRQTVKAEKQTKIAKDQTEEAEKQKALAESNARETSRKLAQHFQYRANELLSGKNANQDPDNAMGAVVLLTEAMRISEPFRESIAERLKIQTLLKDKRIPEQLFHHPSTQAFTAFHKSTVLTCGQDHTVQLWDARNEQPIGPALKFRQPLKNAVFSPDGKFVAVYDAKLTWVIDCRSGKSIAGPLEIEPRYQYSDKLKTYADRPETSRVAFIGSDRIAVMCTSVLKIFDIASGNVSASVKKPEGFVFRSFKVLDNQHLWVNVKSAFGSLGILQVKPQLVSSTDGSVIRAPAQNVSRMIAPKTGTAMVFENDVTYVQQLVDNKRLVEFPNRSEKHMEGQISSDSTIFLAWYNEGDKARIHLADVAGKKITIPPLNRENIFKIFLPDEQHLLVAYHANRQSEFQRRLEVWNFRTGQLKGSASIEEHPDLCCINGKSDKVVFSKGKQLWFWDLQNGVHRLSGNHLNDISELAFVDAEHCLSSDGGIVKKWKFPAPESAPSKIIWARGKFDSITQELAFGNDLIAFPSIENEKCYFSVFDEKQQRLIADSVHLADAKSFHWTPLHFSSDGELLLVPYWTKQKEKRCLVWDAKSKQRVKLDASLRQVVRIDRDEIIFLGGDGQLHFQSLTDSTHDSLLLGPLKDGKAQSSPDGRCIVVEGEETTFLVDLEKRKVVFDDFSFFVPNNTCWLAKEHAFWCRAKKQFSKINWLTGEVLVEKLHRDSTWELTCLPGKNILISKGSTLNGRIRASTSLKFWDLAGNDLRIEIPVNNDQKFYRSADDQFVHVPGVDSITTVSTINHQLRSHSDLFLRDNLKTAKTYTSENRNYMAVWPKDGKYRVYDLATLTAISKPFSVNQQGFSQSSSSFDTFRIGGEIMALSTSGEINLYQTETGYKVDSILARDHLDIERDLKRNYRVVKGRRSNQLVLVNEKKNEMAIVDIATGNLPYETASLQSNVVAEQYVDSTNAVVPLPKLQVIRSFKELVERD